MTYVVMNTETNRKTKSMGVTNNIQGLKCH